ncbi:YusW family protein [Alkalicoccobacillus plakortidis]|uniref:YusW family protein n=1 Tax=Alkalicoccobacillus plakortidis TaxID=444060 RepID=A0ABT0XLB1_9BACI|nr:YusW family protein [Alkalicoccobacillus plakortidis]MCM2676697.1 YusW family protein [Alkalicoccobacillus plakortidis]
MRRIVYGLFMLLLVTSCQSQVNEKDATPAKVQSVGDYVDQIKELTLQVVYENGEEVRAQYVQGEPEQWMYHNDLLNSNSINEDQLSEKIELLTIDKATFTEEVIQQARYVFEFGGTYDILDLHITFADGTKKHYETNDH